MAAFSAVVSGRIAAEVIRDGYILVNGEPSHEIGAVATALGAPFSGVLLGLALFFLVPKVRAPKS